MTGKTSWGVFELPDSTDIHVVPINDEKPHDLTPDCGCEPKMEIVGVSLLYIHKAYDFREVIEYINEGSLS
jgi:hypothetical protein